MFWDQSIVHIRLGDISNLRLLFVDRLLLQRPVLKLILLVAAADFVQALLMRRLVKRVIDMISWRMIIMKSKISVRTAVMKRRETSSSER